MSDLTPHHKDGEALEPIDAQKLSELAQNLDASPFHLARLFRRHTGLSLHGYRTRVRLLSALERPRT